MINFIKYLISLLKANINSNNNEKNDNKKKKEIDQDEQNIKMAQKILYITIILCAIIFVVVMIVIFVKAIPNIISSIENYFDENQSILNNLKTKIKT